MNRPDDAPGFNIDALRAEFPILTADLHYLDNGATAQMPRFVMERMAKFETAERANVKRGAHRLAEIASGAFEDARARIARFIHAPSPQEIVFTSGATAAINLVAQSYGALLEPGDEIAVSRLEHHANLVPWQMACARYGLRLRAIDATKEGRLDLASLDRAITKQCRLVAVTHASNVTGAISDLTPIVARAHKMGARVLVDGAQFIPHDKVDIEAIGIDFYVFSGHKLYGPGGVGVLWGHGELLASMEPAFGGGEMITRVRLESSEYAPPPHRFEAGTPPIAAAIGLGAAIEWLEGKPRPALVAHEAQLTEYLLRNLSAIKGVRILGPVDLQARIGVVSFVLEAAHAHDVCQILDEGGVAVRGGHHCAQPLMEHFDVTASTRASIAPYNTMRDIDALLEGVERARTLFSES